MQTLHTDAHRTREVPLSSLYKVMNKVTIALAWRVVRWIPRDALVDRAIRQSRAADRAIDRCHKPTVRHKGGLMAGHFMATAVRPAGGDAARREEGVVHAVLIGRRNS
jgi:hypothetical protein